MGVERREHSPSAGFLHLPPRMDGLKILWNPRMLLADLIVAGGLLAAWTVMKNAQDNTRQASPFVPRSQPVDVPPSFAPTEVNGENMVVAPATPTEWATWTPQPKATETPAAVATVTGVPTPVRSEEKPTQTPSKYKQLENGGWVYENRLVIPGVEGLKIIKKDEAGVEKAIYIAEKENPYGLKEGDYAGEFAPNVMMEKNSKQEQTGGVALIAPVVSQLIQEKLAIIPNQEDKWLIVLAGDIRNSDQPTSVYFGSKTFGKDSASFVYINLPGKRSLANVIPNTKELSIVTSFVPYYMQYYDSLLNMENNSINKVKGREMSYIYVLSKLERGTRKIQSQFGNKVGDVDGNIMIAYGVPGNFSAIGPKKILTVRDVPVCLVVSP